jgi:hypothetical protein
LPDELRAARAAKRAAGEVFEVLSDDQYLDFGPALLLELQ